MGKICILTDSTAQFLQPKFPGQNHIDIIPLNIHLNGSLIRDNNLKAKDLPALADDRLRPRLLSPSTEELRSTIIRVSQRYDEVLGIFLSSRLNSFYSIIQEVVSSLGEKSRIQVIDSQAVSAGLGFIVQSCAQHLHQNASFAELERLACSYISRIYSIFYLPGLSYLHFNGYLDHAQAYVGEMLGMLPTYGLEDGGLTPLEKMRNQRHTIDFFQEFLSEFENLEHIALLQSAPPSPQLTRLIREYAKANFPSTPLTEHRINLPLATLFGPRSAGVIVVES